MKKVEAFIKRDRIDAVSRAVHHVDGITGMTLTDARGFGRGHTGDEMHPSEEMIHDFHDVARIEVFCRDEIAEPVISAIEQAAHTGLRGDGKVYVLPVEKALRISSGERGEAAV